MKKHTSHSKILELWEAVEPQRSHVKDSWFKGLAAELDATLPHGITVSYYTVRRWWERDNVPIQYHTALIAAAGRRLANGDERFAGINAELLSTIKSEEYIREHAAA